jgi:IPT/TIG domain-containing protein
VRRTGLATGLSVLLGVALAAGPASPAPAALPAPTVAGGHGSLASPDQARQGKPAAAPTVARVTPSSGPAGGGTEVVIKGRGFTGVKRVLFGTSKGTDLQVKTSRKLVVVAPANAAGVVPVRVVSKQGSSKQTAAARFTYTATPTPTPAPAAPSLSAVSPATGPTAGGTVVTLSGSQLTGATAVRFGRTNASSFQIVSPTTVVATTGGHAVGAVNVTVSTPGGSSVLEEAFTYAPPPTLDHLTPGSGPAAGSTVTMTGTGLTAGSVVTFGGITAGAVQASADGTELTATTPAHAPGWVDVTVRTVGGPATLVSGYQYVGGATLTAVSPATGPTSGGITVTLTGTGFTGETLVTFGNKPAPPSSVSANLQGTQLTATLPTRSTPGAVDVLVATVGGSATLTAGFTYFGAPTLTSVAPAEGPASGGTSATLVGTNFQTGMQVRFGGVLATLDTVSATQATVTTPAHGAGPVDVSVTTPGGTATRSGSFTYVSVPTLTGVVPNEGPTTGGQTVTLTGSGFRTGMLVTFGGSAGTALSIVSPTEATVVAPAHGPGAVNVTVSTPGGTATLAGGYTYVVAPALTSVTPDNGPTGGGTTVTLTGSGLRVGMQVRLGGALAAIGSVDPDGTSASVTTPAHAAGTVDVTVTTPGGTATLINGYTYVAAPVLTSVAPDQGPTAGSQTVTLTGSGFRTGMQVWFGGVQATVVSVDPGGASASVTTPAHAAGVVDVSVGTTGGSGSLPGGYTFVAAPALTAVAPGQGPTDGGQTVTLSGTGLSGTSSVTFGGVDAVVGSVTPTSVTVTTPPHAAGAVDVLLTTPGGTSTLAQGYTYAAAPDLASVTPDQGPTAGGQTVTLDGTGLSGTSSVTFGGLDATIITVTPTSVTVTTPGQTAGAVDVAVTTTIGTSTLVAGYTYVAPPAVTSLSPDNGPTPGGQTVTLTGTGLAGTSSVTFGGAEATIVSVTPDSVTVTTPAGSAGAVDVVVATPTGTTTLVGAYTYVDV